MLIHEQTACPSCSLPSCASGNVFTDRPVCFGPSFVESCCPGRMEMRTSITFPALIVFLASALPVPAGAQRTATTDSALTNGLRAFVEAEAEAGRFSGAVLAAAGGTPLLEVAAGFADRRARRAITLDTRFNLASGDKLFTKIA